VNVRAGAQLKAFESLKAHEPLKFLNHNHSIHLNDSNRKAGQLVYIKYRKGKGYHPDSGDVRNKGNMYESLNRTDTLTRRLINPTREENANSMVGREGTCEM
jgi:hypothetical protein